MLKLILKIWPSLLPIAVYIFWMYIVEGIILKRLLRKKDTIEGQKIVGNKTTKEDVEKLGIFSLKNRCFVVILYMSLFLGILTLLLSAF